MRPANTATLRAECEVAWITIPAPVTLLWRQRLGTSAVLSMLDATAHHRRTLRDLIGTGRRALR